MSAYNFVPVPLTPEQVQAYNTNARFRQAVDFFVATTARLFVAGAFEECVRLQHDHDDAVRRLLEMGGLS